MIPDDRSKAAWRRHFRSALRQMSPADRTAQSAAIRTAILHSQPWHDASSVMIFAAMADEPDLLPLLDAAGRRHILFPRIATDGSSLSIHQVNHPQQLIPNPWGIREPDPAQCPPWDPHGVGLILVPGLAFGHDGSRLGHGKGFYDRLLASTSQAITCGVAFQCQLVPSLPTEPHDIPMQCLVSPQGWRRLRNPS